jgi:hypothetical protein
MKRLLLALVVTLTLTPICDGGAPRNEKEPPLGLEGQCPVTLVKEHRWQPGDRACSVVHEGHRYWMASRDAQRAFIANTKRYVPVLDGDDVVEWIELGGRIPGDRRHGVFFADRIWLFHNEENLAQFSADVERYSHPEARPKPRPGENSQKVASR